MATYFHFNQFSNDLTVLGIPTLEVRRPRTTRIPKGALYAVVVATAADAKQVEYLVDEYNTVGNTGQALLQCARQSAVGNGTAITVLVWGFKPVYR